MYLAKIMKHLSFINHLSAETSKGTTANGAVTYTETGSRCLDLFSQAGAMRGKTKEFINLFEQAFYEDRQTAVRILFYLRDVRGGQGERDLFRNCLQWLGENYKDVFEKVIANTPEFGRWDDLFFDNDKCFELIKAQIKLDVSSETPSLLAKWLPTINASSVTTKSKAKFAAKKLGMEFEEYRKTVRSLRKKIQTVEEKMSANEWKEINYSSVPSRASMIYKNAFKKHDDTRYSEFISKAEKGEVKINASTLYPYEIYNKVNSDYSPTLEALWNQLPDYTKGDNAIVVADTSGSMLGNPMSVAVSLALYYAEKNKGLFNGYFMTFSKNTRLHKVSGSNLKEKMRSIQIGEVANTDLQKVFDTILKTALENNCPADELPKTIYIISDMEFDSACDNSKTNLDVIRLKYQESGYEMPNIVFWNVNASGKNVPARKHERGIAMVSGFSPSIFKMAVENKSPEEIMLDAVNSERYSVIKV